MIHSPAFAQAAGADAPAGGASIFIQLIPLLLLFVIFWVLIIRPQQKRLKEHREMVASVKKGDEVVTGGGLIGRVTRVTDEEVEVELAPQTRVRVVKSTLSSVTPRGGTQPANDTGS